MNNIFTFILQMSISASVIALIVMIARYFLRNSPKIYSYILWSAVLLRLICPFSLTLEIPMETQAEPLSPTVESEQVNAPDFFVSEDPVYSATPEYPSDNVTDPEHTNTPVATIPNTENPVKTAVKPINVLTALWLIGVAAMIGYMAWSYISLYSHVKTSTRVRGTVFKSDRINTAFVLGVINPKVYIPSYLSFDDAKGVILHEQTHIRRGDHIVKIIAFVALAVHWFNPFIWLSYWLMSIDMEHSCDEAVMEGLCDRGYKLSGVKRGYGQILISLAIKDIKMPSVAFSENNVKGRLSHILNYKGASNNTRKILWASCAALFILCALLPVIKGTEVDAVNHGLIAGSPLDYSAIELDYSDAGLDDVSAFAGCKKLESLDLSGNFITDISPLTEISTLKSLDLAENCISDFSALGSLKNLEHLEVSLYDGNLSGLPALKKLPNLKSLTIYCGSADTSKTWSDAFDLSMLAEYNSVEELQIYMWESVCNLSTLSEMPKLSSLGLNVEYGASCIMPNTPSDSLTELSLDLLINEDASHYLFSIASPQKLRSLSISTGGAELLHITEYTGLEALSLDLCDDIDFGELKKLENLWQLSYSKHDEMPPDISGISELTSVTSLSLTLCNLSDITKLSEMTWLANLDLSGNRIEDISALSDMGLLRSLNLCSNNITDVAPLSSLTSLKELNLRSNKISVISPLNSLRDLQMLDISNNPVDIESVVGDIPDLSGCDIISDYSENSESGSESTPQTGYLPDLSCSGISSLDDLRLIPEEDLDTHIVQIDCDLFFSECKAKKQAYNATGDPKYAPPYEEFETLKNTAELKHLELYNVAALDASELTDILTGMPHLQTLIVSGGYVDSEKYILDLRGLSQLQELKYLQLLNIPVSDENLVDIASLSNLCELNLNAGEYPYNASGSADLSPLSRLSNLRKLTLFLSSTLHDNIVIDDISSIGELEALESLAIGINKTTDYSALGRLTSLEELILPLNQDADCSFIRFLTGLTRLDVSDHGERNESFIDSVSQLSNLKELSLTGSSFSNIDWLENVQSLEKIHLTNTGTQSISVFSRLKNLKSAHLSNFEYSGVDLDALKAQVYALNESTDDCEIVLDAGKG